MDNLWFQKITITQIQYINVQQILVVIFEFTGAARLCLVRHAGSKRLDNTDINEQLP